MYQSNRANLQCGCLCNLMHAILSNKSTTGHHKIFKNMQKKSALECRKFASELLRIHRLPLMNLKKKISHIIITSVTLPQNLTILFASFMVY